MPSGWGGGAGYVFITFGKEKEIRNQYWLSAYYVQGTSQMELTEFSQQPWEVDIIRLLVLFH